MGKLTNDEYLALETFLAHCGIDNDLGEVLGRFEDKPQENIIRAARKIANAAQDKKPLIISTPGGQIPITDYKESAYFAWNKLRTNWVITHKPTGYLVGMGIQESAIINAISSLEAIEGMDWSETDVEKVMEAGNKHGVRAVILYWLGEDGP